MVLALVAVTIAAALAAAIFVLPVKTMFDQDDQIAERTDQLSELQAVNNDLRSEVARLKTDDGIKEAARRAARLRRAGRDPPVDPRLPCRSHCLAGGWPYRLILGHRRRADEPAGRSRGTPTTAATRRDLRRPPRARRRRTRTRVAGTAAPATP